MKVDRGSDPEQPGPSSSGLRAVDLGEPQQVPSLVLQVSPGGLEYAGGIGRMIGYMIDAWGNRRSAPGDRQGVDGASPSR